MSLQEGVSKPLPQIQPVKAPPAQKPNGMVHVCMTVLHNVTIVMHVYNSHHLGDVLVGFTFSSQIL